MLNNAALLFRCPRSRILSALMENFVRRYNPNVWGTGGPELYTRVWKAWHVRNASAYAAIADLNVLPSAVFYPLHWWESRHYHAPEPEGSQAVIVPGVTVGVHMWNKVYNNGSSRVWHNASLATRIVRERCGASTSRSLSRP